MSSSEGEESSESKTKMVQRHKREMKELQTKIKGMMSEAKKSDKKGKAEIENTIKQMEKDLIDKHNEEAHKWEKPAPPTQTQPTESIPEIKPKKGPSKKQQKKNNKLLQEDERIKRIELAQKDVVPMRIVENQAILEKLKKSMGFTIKEIPPDGNCLYNAVADQLKILGIPSPRDHHLILRNCAVDYMVNHRDDFEPFISTEEDFEKYCARMRDSSVWGGQIELQALAHALKVPIIVHAADVPDVVMGEEYIKFSNSIHLSYHKHAYALGEHYNSVIPLLQKQISRKEGV
eukprot:TRINITY_DN6564_c0_g2_i2.p1 TRINITY_DN6564_c0_g2~~TRINITY_DN6564_c0_g2_i2.p1  ORF type:complete len:290 (+),score=49.64 TRINITY_DN6564_c0_g2_i2:896-1765(+)